MRRFALRRRVRTIFQDTSRLSNLTNFESSRIACSRGKVPTSYLQRVRCGQQSARKAARFHPAEAVRYFVRAAEQQGVGLRTPWPRTVTTRPDALPAPQR